MLLCARILLEDWLFHVCPLVVASPNKRDMVSIVDPDNPEHKIKVRKYLYMFSQREIYNCAIKDPKDGGFSGFRDPKDQAKVWISRSTMERMLPKELKRMSPSHKSMCGCEICIDGWSMFFAS